MSRAGLKPESQFESILYAGVVSYGVKS